eukprot:GFYU01009819.1.p1 GENE.GFYU01009819.1~~GFYU01009819.1.p1  ORF type:complete len:127 (-),score=30.64 GFYU01009819.1:36-416(-)
MLDCEKKINVRVHTTHLNSKGAENGRSKVKDISISTEKISFGLGFAFRGPSQLTTFLRHLAAAKSTGAAYVRARARVDRCFVDATAAFEGRKKELDDATKALDQGYKAANKQCKAQMMSIFEDLSQ